MDPAEIMYEQAMLCLQQPMLEAAARGDSEVQRFYRGTTALVTGGTGYLGKVLIEKLIRSCKIHKIYLLLRPKKGKEISERLNVLLEDVVFDQLRKKQPEFGQIITPVVGDIVDEQLGLNNQDWSTVTQNVDIILHLAATTKFNELLRTATLINVRGTREALMMAKQCKKLKSFVYVSTAFCHATRSRIDSEILEQFYRSPICPEVLIGMAESMEDERLIAVTEKLIDDWPNTYTFTKAVAEELVRTSGGNLPICIVRPPIVIGSYSEPSPGWTDKSCIYGPIGMALEIMLGATHVILLAPITVNIAPVDFVANALIVSALETKIRYDNGHKEIKIYTLCSQDLFNAAQANKLLRSEGGKILQSPKCIWYSCAHEISNKYLFWLLTWMFHYIPAYILDAVYFLLQLKRPRGVPSFVKVYKKIYNASQIFSYFSLNQWHWRDDNTVEMFRKMSATDKALFNFDLRPLNIIELSFINALGVRKHIIQDGLKNTAIGVRKQFWFKIATYIILPIYAYLIISIILWIYRICNFVIYL